MKWPGDLTRLSRGWAERDGDDCQDRAELGDEALGTFHPARSGHLALAGGVWTLAPLLVTRDGCLADSCHPWALQHSRVPWNILRMVMVNSE